MWTRGVLKARAKRAFKANYWRSVLTSLIIIVITGGILCPFVFEEGKVIYSEIYAINYMRVHELSASTQSYLFDSLKVITTALGIVFLIFTLLNIFLLNPILVGCDNFFLSNRNDSKTTLGALKRGFSPKYGNVIKTIFLTELFICLWTLLLIIPGIIKTYQYRLVPYILTEDPTINSKEARNRSKELMMGHKWRSFVLDISFILWYLLGGLTLGILNIFYVNPYINATDTELYMQLAHPEQAKSLDPTLD